MELRARNVVQLCFSRLKWTCLTVHRQFFKENACLFRNRNWMMNKQWNIFGCIGKRQKLSDILIWIVHCIETLRIQHSHLTLCFRTARVTSHISRQCRDNNPCNFHWIGSWIFPTDNNTDVGYSKLVFIYSNGKCTQGTHTHERERQIERLRRRAEESMGMSEWIHIKFIAGTFISLIHSLLPFIVSHSPPFLSFIWWANEA